jgi:uncharacterized SAM-binding protein YcdF (DUF218 family)
VEEVALMFFVLSKTVAILLLPSNLLMLLAVLGVLLLLTRWRRAGAILASAAIVVMALVSFLPLGAALLQPIESRFPRWSPANGAPDGIIVLGGAIAPLLSDAHGEPVVSSDAGRVIALAQLARTYPKARIVFSGGDAELLPKGLAEARFIYPLLDQLGVPRERVMLESRSRNTVENAQFTKELVKPKPDERWLLVTSAFHMPRAIGCFRRAGFNVEAYPVNWRTTSHLADSLTDQLSNGLGTLDLAVHEWTGLFVYWLTGRTGALLPSP